MAKAIQYLLPLPTQGRYVTLLRLEGKVYCIDSVCFHAGGPLVGSHIPYLGSCSVLQSRVLTCTLQRAAQGVGDIEEVNGRACLVCPWHYYKVCAF
jgi:nitrite reductase/ring-hydroxylating ferredoxin subunit